ncbi:oxidoreductase family protein [Diaporthe helianthi]|uniref:Oxidoreductase family protein n=1 Tax=Diaporthe helianthi TaxID=158607 RepID=A0A2P5HYS6_DIAHE|nr:oxidoreductase family protein [Diaporthe helianthi]
MSVPTPAPIAIIGGGIFVKEQHLVCDSLHQFRHSIPNIILTQDPTQPAVLATPLLSLKAIYSRSLKSAKETSQLLPASHSAVDLYSEDSGPAKSFKDILSRSDIVGVIIALPIRNQPAFIEAALKAGKHVLAEKPVGTDVASAKKLILWYREIAAEKKVTWAVAEQFRFLPKYVWAAEQARLLGRVIGFNFRVFQLCKQGACTHTRGNCGTKKELTSYSDNKYFNTEWRKSPTHPYGFILDGGVHSTAAVRMLLGQDQAQTVIGYSSLAQQHLAPVDTLSAVIKTKSGAVGSFTCSWGTTMKAAEYTVACENGSVTVEGDAGWILHKDGGKTEKDFPFIVGSGVTDEVQAWGAAIAEGKENALLTPEVTLGDLELLEAMLKSAEDKGAPKKLYLQ